MFDFDLAAIRQRAGESVLGKPMARALDQAIADRRALLDHVDTLTARLAVVRELHQERPNSTSALYPNPLCSCGKEYPCPTIQTIEGENDD